MNFYGYLLLVALLCSVLDKTQARRPKQKDAKDRSDTKAKTVDIDSMICPECDRLFCTVRKASKLKCKGGKTTDICGCCPVCAKQIGEPCGGEWNYLGKCDVGLYCRAATLDLTPTFYQQIKTEIPMGGIPEGTCVKGKYITRWVHSP